MANERQRNNVRAGIFMLVAIAVAMGVILSLTDIVNTLRRPTEKYTVTFDVVTGVSSLASGSAVRVGGVTLGEVLDVRPRTGTGGPLETIDVTFELDRSIELFADAKIIVGSALIGSEAWLEIFDVGMSGSAKGSPLTGIPSTGMLGSVLGPDGDQIMDDVRGFVGYLGDIPEKHGEDVETFMEFLGEVPAKYESDLEPTLVDVRELVAEVRDETWPRWEDRVDVAITAATELLEQSRDLVTENREKVDAIVDNVHSGTARFDELGGRLNEETVRKVHDLIDRGDEGLDEAVAMIQRLQQDYELWAGDLGEVMGNASLASQQLKLTTAEIRRSPWKILYRPSVEELDHELLYEAARSFAMAATDLQGASESVRRVLDNHAGQIDEAAFGRLQRNLTASLDNYERAQRELFEVLVVEPAP